MFIGNKVKNLMMYEVKHLLKLGLTLHNSVLKKDFRLCCVESSDDCFTVKENNSDNIYCITDKKQYNINKLETKGWEINEPVFSIADLFNKQENGTFIINDKAEDDSLAVAFDIYSTDYINLDDKSLHYYSIDDNNKVYYHKDGITTEVKDYSNLKNMMISYQEIDMLWFDTVISALQKGYKAKIENANWYCSLCKKTNTIFIIDEKTNKIFDMRKAKNFMYYVKAMQSNKWLILNKNYKSISHKKEDIVKIMKEVTNDVKMP